MLSRQPLNIARYSWPREDLRQKQYFSPQLLQDPTKWAVSGNRTLHILFYLWEARSNNWTNLATVVYFIYIGDFTIRRRRRQRGRQKAIGFQNNNLERESLFYVHFFAVTARLRCENA